MEYSTGNEIVDQMKSLNITGNVIPPIWYKVFNNKEIESEASGKIRLLAINILADIVYWYRPTEIRDEKTGFVIGYKKKFKADLLQRSYDDLCQMFMCSKKDGQRAVAFLESFGVIKRVFRTLKVSGITVANVLFLQLDVDILKSLTYPDVLPYGQNSPYPKTHTSTPKNEIVHTNTESTPYISPKNSFSKKERNRETYDEIIENFSQGNKELETQLKEYLQMRFTKQKRLSNVSLKATLNNLLKVSGNNQVDMIEIVNKAVRKEQLDFYPLSEKEKQPKIEQNTSYNVEEYEQYLKNWYNKGMLKEGEK